MNAQTTMSPPPVPIIVNDTDYQMFLQLVVLGNMILPFGTDDYDDQRSVVLWIKYSSTDIRDGCQRRWGGYDGARSLATLYLIKITAILAYFHQQVDPGKQINYSDSIYTSNT
jgi:hypothetical protein